MDNTPDWPSALLRRIVDPTVSAWTYLAADPLRILTIIGGSGGVMYWWDRIRSRPKIRLRLLEETAHEGSSTSHFEAINLGGLTTALEPTIELRGVSPAKRRVKLILRIMESDRTLPPHVPKRFRAVVGDPGEEVGFLWFRRYTARLTRGPAATVRVRNAYLQAQSLPRFWFERTRFFLTGDVTSRKAPPVPLTPAD